MMTENKEQEVAEQPLKQETGNNGWTPEDEARLKADVEAELDDIMNTTQGDLSTPFMFGWMTPPRFLWFHVIMFMLIGAAAFVLQFVRVVDIKAFKLAVEDPKGGHTYSTVGDITLWPTINCIIVAYILIRRIGLRRNVVGVRLNALTKGFTITVKDAEDVVWMMRSSFVGGLIAFFTFATVVALELVIISEAIRLYTKFFV